MNMHTIITKKGYQYFTDLNINKLIENYGTDFIIISNNTIKVPVATYQNIETGEIEYKLNEFEMPNSFNVTEW